MTHTYKSLYEFLTMDKKANEKNNNIYLQITTTFFLHT